MNDYREYFEDWYYPLNAEYLKIQPIEVKTIKPYQPKVVKTIKSYQPKNPYTQLKYAEEQKIFINPTKYISEGSVTSHIKSIVYMKKITKITLCLIDIIGEYWVSGTLPLAFEIGELVTINYNIILYNHRKSKWVTLIF